MVGSKIRDYRRKRWLGSTIKFLEGVIKRLKDKNSTLGFEILNEPQVFRQVDFRK
jgi:hypothetical protein